MKYTQAATFTCYVAFGIFLITVSLGMVEGYSAILLPQLEKEGKMKIDEEMSSWIASISALPTPLGCVLGGYLMEKIGRKNHSHGRFLTGICLGILGPPSGVYAAEISDPEFRGFLLAITSLAIMLGIAISHILGTYISWQNTALIGCVFPILCFVVMVPAPESPTFLAKKSKISEAKKAFYWCRGFDKKAELELQELLTRQTAITELPKKNCLDYLKDLGRREFVKPLAIMIVFFFTVQWCGNNAMTFYNVTIIQLTIGDSFDGYTSMIIMDLIRLIVSVLSCYLMKIMGRRPLALLSSVGTTLSLFVLSGFTFCTKFYPHLNDYSLFALVVLVVYMSVLTIGLVPVPWAVMSEIFPLAHRGIGNGLSSLINYAFIFSVVKPTPWMFTNMGNDGTFLLFGCLCLAGTVALAIFLPETKNKPLHEIEDHFKGVQNSCCC
ncbi:hypothetical protein NQ314_011168 [Rhamnusium bicolor]|uniref:Major facilitator superfamily (MFS) profile domain-containing protein n=1 Tax=Rhamnusium bicolor TaxID=1586634 RepID=A0AAV8XKJ3_9CUCU|nr:hypothetical protein NQ314_011168 [Rhamnusium bicolor]